jgi:tryptophan-rich sensory protein
MKRKIILYLSILLTWFIGLTFFPIDISFYNTLNHPLFDLNFKIFYTIQIINYFFISYTLFYNILNFENIKNYLFYYILNYIFVQIFPLFFFCFSNLFLSVVIYSLIFSTSIKLYIENKKLNENNAKYLYFYLLSTAFYLMYFLELIIIN